MRTFCYTLLFMLLFAAEAGAQLGFEGGINFATMNIKLRDEHVQSSFVRNANFGVLAGIAISPHVYLEPAVFFETGGCTLRNRDKREEIELQIVDVPLFVMYKSGTRCASRFLLGGGLNIGNNINGSYSRDSIARGIPDSGTTFTFGDLRGNFMKKKGYSLGLCAGYQFSKHFYIKGRYLWCFDNLNPARDPKNKIQTMSFALNVGYVIAPCKRGEKDNTFAVEKGDHWRGLRKNRYSRKQRFIRGA